MSYYVLDRVVSILIVQTVCVEVEWVGLQGLAIHCE